MPATVYGTSTTRTIKERGDIEDLITILDPDSTPLYSSIGHRTVSDPNPKTLTSSLSSFDDDNFHSEEANAPEAEDEVRAVVQNWCQILQKTAEVTEYQNAVAQYGMGKELIYQEVQKGIELRRDIEGFLLSDQVRQAPTAANERTPKMDGMSTIVSTNTNNTFSQANYDTLIAAVAGYGGKPTIAYMDSTRKIAVGTWTATPTRFMRPGEAKVVESEVLRYHSDIGPMVEMIWHHWMPKDIASTNGAHFLLIQPDLWQICMFLPTNRKTLPDEGKGPSSLIKVSLAPLCRAEEGNLKFY